MSEDVGTAVEAHSSSLRAVQDGQEVVTRVTCSRQSESIRSRIASDVSTPHSRKGCVWTQEWARRRVRVLSRDGLTETSRPKGRRNLRLRDAELF
jgi:hypothetical protein